MIAIDVVPRLSAAWLRAVRWPTFLRHRKSLAGAIFVAAALAASLVLTTLELPAMMDAYTIAD